MYLIFQVIEKEQLQQNAKEVGTYFLNQLESLRSVHEVVGDVRGQGLMIGVEFVESKESCKPLSKEKFQQIFNRTKGYGVLFGCGGFYGNVLRVKPPMCISKENVDQAIDALDKSIKDSRF